MKIMRKITKEKRNLFVSLNITGIPYVIILIIIKFECIYNKMEVKGMETTGPVYNCYGLIWTRHKFKNTCLKIIELELMFF